MDFTFPSDKTINKGSIRNFKIDKNNKFDFNLIDITSPTQNLITIDNTDYYFKYLNDNDRNKGGNSIILELFEAQNVDDDDVEYGVPDLILKILKFKKSNNTNYPFKSEKRFNSEISALQMANEKKSQNLIKIIHSGTCKIWAPWFKKYEDYLYYTMEYAERDLKSYIEDNHSVMGFEEKINICVSLAKGIDELQSYGYYHRDIKPDNIFIVDNEWKIGDLGLCAERYKENEIDSVSEFIGPRGWASPEVMNKHLTEGHGFKETFDVIIDHQSDIFQLGKVFWYIFQHNSPIGSIKMSDFKVKNNRVYPIIRTMLNHSKKRRYSEIKEVISLFEPIEKELLKQLG